MDKRQKGTARPNHSSRSKATKVTGDWGEEVAREYLIALGFAIRELKWRGPHYEVDIIAQKGTRVAFVEVKTRTDRAVDPASAVNHRKRQRMVNAADVYLQSLGQPLDYEFDIISISGTKDDFTIEYISDAFFPSATSRAGRISF